MNIFLFFFVFGLEIHLIELQYSFYYKCTLPYVSKKIIYANKNQDIRSYPCRNAGLGYMETHTRTHTHKTI